MMSGMPLETCWAFNERWNNKFYYKVASCWFFLLIHTTMHESMNIKSPCPLPKRVLCTVRSSASSVSNSTFLSLPEYHKLAAYVFFLVFSLLLSSLQQRVLEGSSYARCVQSSYPAFVLLCVGWIFPPGLSVGLTLFRISRDRSNWTEFFSGLTFQNILPFKARINSHLLFAGVISSPFSPR